MKYTKENSHSPGRMEYGSATGSVSLHIYTRWQTTK